jgi:hypothetical protein
VADSPAARPAPQGGEPASLRRRTQARSRFDEKLTVAIVLVFGVLIAPTAFGQGILDVVVQVVQGVSQSGR